MHAFILVFQLLEATATQMCMYVPATDWCKKENVTGLHWPMTAA